MGFDGRPVVRADFSIDADDFAAGSRRIDRCASLDRVAQVEESELLNALNIRPILNDWSVEPREIVRIPLFHGLSKPVEAKLPKIGIHAFYSSMQEKRRRRRAGTPATVAPSSHVTFIKRPRW
jgi:hypothetical protein